MCMSFQEGQIRLLLPAVPCVHVGLLAVQQLQQMPGRYQLRAVSVLDGLGQNPCVAACGSNCVGLNGVTRGL